MAYSNFKGATGKHGNRISRRLRQILKAHLARQGRKQKQKLTKIAHRQQ